MNSTNHSLSSLEDDCNYRQIITHDEYVVSDYFFTVLAIIINLLTCPFVILLNSLVIIAIKNKPRLQTPHNILLACLAVTDLMVGIGAQPAFITQKIIVLIHRSSALACWRLGYAVNLTIRFLCIVSLLHLVLTSIERFVAIKYPLRYEDFVNTFRVAVAVGCCWLYNFITVFLISILLRLNLFLSYITFLVSFAVIIFCHVYVYLVCRRHEAQIQSEQIPHGATAKFLKEKKAWKTTSIIIGGFIVCYFPGFVTGLVRQTFPSFLIRRLFESSTPLGQSLYLLNSLCNPIIYCWRSKEIRKGLMQLLKRSSNEVVN